MSATMATTEGYLMGLRRSSEDLLMRGVQIQMMKVRKKSQKHSEVVEYTVAAMAVSIAVIKAIVMAVVMATRFMRIDSVAPSLPPRLQCLSPSQDQMCFQIDSLRLD